MHWAFEYEVMWSKHMFYEKLLNYVTWGKSVKFLVFPFVKKKSMKNTFYLLHWVVMSLYCNVRKSSSKNLKLATNKKVLFLFFFFFCLQLLYYSTECNVSNLRLLSENAEWEIVRHTKHILSLSAQQSSIRLHIVPQEKLAEWWHSKSTLS